MGNNNNNLDEMASPLKKAVNDLQNKIKGSQHRQTTEGKLLNNLNNEDGIAD